MSVGFEFQWDPPLESLQFGLEHWANLIEDFTEPFTAIEQVFRKHEKRLFDTEGGYGPSGDWEGLSAAYAAWKARNFPGRGILVRGGTMRAALVEGKGAGAIKKITGSFLEVGIDDQVIPYAAIHQSGRGIPQRKPMDFNLDIRNRGSLGWVILQVLQAYVVWARKKAFAQTGRLDEEIFDLDGRAESSILAAMEEHTGNADAVKALEDAALAEMGLG